MFLQLVRHSPLAMGKVTLRHGHEVWHFSSVTDAARLKAELVARLPHAETVLDGMADSPNGSPRAGRGEASIERQDSVVQRSTRAILDVARDAAQALLDDMVRERGMGLILISHDLNLVASFCDRVLVMYAGQVMEVIEAGNLNDAKHPYTRGLLSCVPELEHPQDMLPVLKRDPVWLNPQGGAND